MLHRHKFHSMIECKSLAKIKDFMMCNALQNDIGSVQGDLYVHHEIYLNNPNKTPPNNNFAYSCKKNTSLITNPISQEFILLYTQILMPFLA